MKKQIKNNIYWVGKIDWELRQFHGADYSINNGSSQNAYLVQEEKTFLEKKQDNLRRELEESLRKFQKGSLEYRAASEELERLNKN